MGRYVESDPIGLDGGVGTYGYANQNPVWNVDPFGEAAITIPFPSLPVPDWVAAPSGRLLGALGLILSLSGDTPQQCDTKCPPCKTISGRIVPVKTIGYRPLDVIPANVKQHGVYGSHHNLFEANQYPYPKCDCFWRKLKDVAKPSDIQPNWIPIEPFVK